MRLADRLRITSHRCEVGVAAVILGDFIAPKHLHRRDVILYLAPAMIEIAAEDRGFLRVPAAADTEQEAAAAGIIEGRDLFGGENRVAFGDEANTRPQFDPGGGGACARQCD